MAATGDILSQRRVRLSPYASELLRLPAGMATVSFAVFFVCSTTAPLCGQDLSVDAPGGAEEVATPDSVDVEPTADDAAIAERLERILTATGWFDDVEINVDEGVAFLQGTSDSEEHREWAGQLAGKTEDVVAVVNRLRVRPQSLWDLSPAWAELRTLAAELIQIAPLALLGLFLLVGSWYAAVWSTRVGRVVLRQQVKNNLLRQVTANALAVPVFLAGLYLVLRISGLSQLALTVIGGTGLVGLVVGFAFRDIAENFLASVLISMQRPFEVGDRIEIDKWHGYVQRVTLRGTVLMTLDGNHVQIPNATVYKGAIRNFSANPNLRLDFAVGIGYDDSVSHAQQVALQVLATHPAVLREPDSMVLVDGLGAATVALRVYFWIDGSQHGFLKVRSSVMRLVKKALQDAGVSLPDEAREVLFPAGVPVRMVDGEAPTAHGEQPARPPAQRVSEHDDSPLSDAEGGLASEAGEIEQQARMSRTLERGENLLDADR